MFKKTGLFLFIVSLCMVFVLIGFAGSGDKSFLVLMLSGALAFLLLGISMWIIHAQQNKLKKIRSLFLVVSLVLLAMSLLSHYNHWAGTNLEGLLAVFIYCFTYAPIELFLKIEKWKGYSTNNWEIFILSTLDFVGLNLVLIGILAFVLQWPGPYILINLGSVILLVGLLLWNARFKKEVIQRKFSEDKIVQQYREIEKEKQISERLLLNILPAEVAEELKAKGSADAKLINEVTVLFTDFKGFTSMSEKLGPKELVRDIHECFSAFDRIMEKYGMEKIKTIGDSYMAAGGLPSPNETHAVDAIHAAMEIVQFIEDGKSLKIAKGLPYFEIRVGIHTGPVVAGIVGVKKFAYDIWGDTVNIASRMESNGEAGKINISGTTYELVKDKFSCIHRGKIEAKGKGELDMYFVIRSLSEG